ncbi:MAG: hypothetical protein ACKV2O_11555 [Acidimicrobiales bacterium]
MCLAEVIRQKASGATRPRMDAVAAWLATRCGPGERVEACVFANVGTGHEEPLARWVANLRDWGWSVFVKPKTQPRDDIDAEMIRYIERPFRQGSLVELIVASHDARAFGAALQRYAQAGVTVTVLGYRERERVAATNANLQFVDIEDVPGAFVEQLPRTNLYDLPSGGRWFGPFAPLVDGPAQELPAAPAEPRTAPLPRSVDEPAPSAPPQVAAGPRPERIPAPVIPAPVSPQSVRSAEPLAPPPPPESAPTPATPATTAADADPSTPLELVIASEDEHTLDLTRDIVVEVLVEETRAATGQTLTLKEAATRLRTRFPGFSLHGSGYLGVADLLDELHDNGRIHVVRDSGVHRLVAHREPDAAAPQQANADATNPAPAVDAPDVIDVTEIIDVTDMPSAPQHPAQPAGTGIGNSNSDRTDTPRGSVAETSHTGTNGTTAIGSPAAAPTQVPRMAPPSPTGPGAVPSAPVTEAVAAEVDPGPGLRADPPTDHNDAELSHPDQHAAVGHPIYRAFGYKPEQVR